MRHVEVALDVKANLGECPRWDEKTQKLYWVDINAFQLHCFDPATGDNKTLTFEEEIGCFALRQDKGFVLAMRHGFFLLDGWNTDLKPITDPEEGLTSNRFNDGRCDAAGRFIAGSYYPPKDHDGANLWTLDTDLSAKKLRGDLLTSNGAAFSPDNKTFYLSDTPKHVIYQYDYDLQAGTIANERVFHQFPHGNGRPDGASVDAEGCYWTALYEGGRVVRLSPQGEILEEVQVPAKCPTMVAFGGADLKTLYVTTVGNRSEEELQEFPHSGAIFKFEVDVPGLVENRFAK
ncbi:6-deoxy-6-sulfogluconolactonase [Thalassocella blandensis]|nr:6-deoxy-6-sulfogluconolactonase [Thalassocella blandensis]